MANAATKKVQETIKRHREKMARLARVRSMRDNDHKTQAEIADRLGVTPQRAQQMLAEADAWAAEGLLVEAAEA